MLAGAAAFAAAALVAPVAALATDTPAISGTGVISMIHGVPGLVADVAVDRKTILTGFTSARVTDPVTLSAGKHTVTLRADNGKEAGKIVLTATLDITAGTTSTAVVGLTPDGTPKAFVFPEKPMSVPAGQAALVVRHVAAAGPVKLVVDGAALTVGTLASGADVNTDTTPGTHQVAVQSTTGATVLGAQPATLQANRVTTLYLTGSEQDKSLVWVATTRLASSLTSLSTIPTGDGSTASAQMTQRRNVSMGAAAAVAAALGMATFFVMLRRARPRGTT